MNNDRPLDSTVLLLAGLLYLSACGTSITTSPKAAAGGKNAFSEYVWPPPPDEARIRLETIITGRADVEADSRLQKVLVGSGPQGPFDKLVRPIGLAFDLEGRILVTDTYLKAIVRFDRKKGVMDVFGTSGTLKLKTPLGISVGSDGTIYVADAGLKRVVALDSSGKLRTAYGREGELANPTDAALSPDGQKLYVADSKAHQIIVYDMRTAAKLSVIGKRGEQPGEFNFPTALAFDRNGFLYVVDQINARVQILTEGGEVIDVMGSRGIGYGNFVRPKGIAIDATGFVYVTDAAFNNVQLFDPDLKLLTFVGEAGGGPGQFQIAGGVDVHGDEFAVVDQLNRRIEVFRYIQPRDSGKPEGKTP